MDRLAESSEMESGLEGGPGTVCRDKCKDIDIDVFC